MIKIKNKEELKIMKKGGKILAEVMAEVLEAIKPGVSEIELDRLAEELIKKRGAEPGFKKVPGYYNTICVSTNEVVVHGIPSDYKLKDKDIIGIDCGVYYKGFHTDMSETVRVRNQKSKIKNQEDEVDIFLATGRKALDEGIKQAKIGNRIGNISRAIQTVVEGKKYSVVRSLVGHGIGRNLHEEPEVPGYLAQDIEKTPLLKEGMVIAIEVIYNMGGSEIIFANNDGWTLKTEDGSLSGLY